MFWIILPTCSMNPETAVTMHLLSVTGILVLEILVRRTNIFAGKYGPPALNWSGLKDARFTSSFLNRTQHDSSSTKGSLGNSQRTLEKS